MGYMRDKKGRRLDLFEVQAADLSTYRNMPLKPLATVMASPPTLSWGVASGASGIPFAVTVAKDNAALTYSGGNVGLSDWGYFTNKPTASTVDVGEGFDIDFTHYGQKLEPVLVATARGLKVDMFVEGEKITATPTSPATVTAGAAYPYTVDFGTASARRIKLRIYAGGTTGIRTEASGTIWKTPRGKMTRLITIGDSFTAPGYDWQEGAWWRRVGERLGIDEVWPMAQSGTGYIQNLGGTNGRTTFGARAINEAIPQAPHAVIFFGSVNDAAVAGFETTLGPAAKAAWASVKSALPDCKVFVVGVQAPSATPSADYIAAGNIIRTAAQEQLGTTVDAYLDPLGWFTGTGRVGATTGNGNSDIFTSNDGLHPTKAGNLYLGERIAQGLSAYYQNRAAATGIRL